MPRVGLEQPIIEKTEKRLIDHFSALSLKGHCINAAQIPMLLDDANIMLKRWREPFKAVSVSLDYSSPFMFKFNLEPTDA